MRSTACWSWDARVMSASLDPERDRGCCAHVPDPCTTAAPAAPARIARRLDQERPCGAARHPALTASHPGLLQAPGRPLYRLNVWYILGILVMLTERLNDGLIGVL